MRTLRLALVAFVLSVSTACGAGHSASPSGAANVPQPSNATRFNAVHGNPTPSAQASAEDAITVTVHSAEQWVVVTHMAANVYPRPSRDWPSTFALAAGSRVGVTGRTDGPSAAALCAVIGDTSTLGWVSCDALDFGGATLAGVPVRWPDPARVHSDPVPRIYSNANVVHLLEECRLSEYRTSHYLGDSLRLRDGSAGWVPYAASPGVHRNEAAQIDDLLRSNQRRCGFTVIQVSE